jgi:parvulin-like peptidyl-prolyl isomerase
LSEDPSSARGGDLGFVQPGDLAPALREAARALARGAVSAVVETANGYVLLKRES